MQGPLGHLPGCRGCMEMLPVANTKEYLTTHQIFKHIQISCLKKFPQPQASLLSLVLVARQQAPPLASQLPDGKVKAMEVTSIYVLLCVYVYILHIYIYTYCIYFYSLIRLRCVQAFFALPPPPYASSSASRSGIPSLRTSSDPE